MSRQTSLQRAGHQSPECHHLFPVVEIRSKPEAEVANNTLSQKTAYQRRHYRHAKFSS